MSSASWYAIIDLCRKGSIHILTLPKLACTSNVDVVP